VDIFKNPTTKAPKKDNMVKRVDFEKPSLAGHPPSPSKSDRLSISHVPNKN
jgi:hypothetical protein